MEMWLPGKARDAEGFVFGGEDADLGVGQFAEHGLSDAIRVAQGKADDGGAGAAEPAAEGAGGDAGIDDAGELGDQLLSVRLVDTILEEPRQRGQVVGSKGGTDQGGAVEVMDGIGLGEVVGNEFAGHLGADFEAGNQRDEPGARADGNRDGADGGVEHSGHGEAAEDRGGGIIGVMFQAGEQLEELEAGEAGFAERIESGKDAKPDGDAGAESAGDGHVAVEEDITTKGSLACVGEETIGSLLDHGGGAAGGLRAERRQNSETTGAIGREPGVVVEVEGDAEGVEARAEVGGRGGDAGGGGERGGRHEGCLSGRDGRVQSSAFEQRVVRSCKADCGSFCS